LRGMRVLCAVDGECVFGCSRRRERTVAATVGARILSAGEALETAARYERLGADARSLREAVRDKKHEMLVAFGDIGRMGGLSGLRMRGGAQVRRLVGELRRKLEQLEAEKELYKARIVEAEQRRESAESKLRHIEDVRARGASAASASASGASASVASAKAANASGVTAPLEVRMCTETETLKAQLLGTQSELHAKHNELRALEARVRDLEHGGAIAGSAGGTTSVDAASMPADRRLDEQNRELVQLRRTIIELEGREKKRKQEAAARVQAPSSLLTQPKSEGRESGAVGSEADAAVSNVESNEPPPPAIMSHADLSRLIQSVKFYYTRAAPPAESFITTYESNFQSIKGAVSKMLLRSRAAPSSKWRVSWSMIAKPIKNLKVSDSKGDSNKGKEETAEKEAGPVAASFTVTEICEAQHDRSSECRLCRFYRHIALALFRSGSRIFFRLLVAGAKIEGRSRLKQELDASPLNKEVGLLSVALNEMDDNANIPALKATLEAPKVGLYRVSEVPDKYKYTSNATTYSFTLIASELQHASYFWPISYFTNYFRPVLNVSAPAAPFEDALQCMTNYKRSSKLGDASIYSKAFNRNIDWEAFNRNIEHLSPEKKAEKLAECESLFRRIELVEYAFWLSSLAWKSSSRNFGYIRARAVTSQAVMRKKDGEGSDAYAMVARTLLQNPLEKNNMLTTMCDEIRSSSNDQKMIEAAFSAFARSESDSVLSFVLDYWEWSQDDKEFSAFLYDIHSVVTTKGVVHTIQNAVAADEDDDIVCLVPVVCTMVRLSLHPESRQAMQDALVRRTAPPQPLAAFGVNRICPFRDGYDESVASRGDSLDKLVKDARTLAAPCKEEDRHLMARLMQQILEPPTWCDVHAWLRRMMHSAQHISTMAAILYADVHNLRTEAVCTSHCCCIYNACNAYARIATTIACEMIDDVTSLLHCTQCSNCAQLLQDNENGEREWRKNCKCTDLVTIQKMGSLKLSVEASTNACALERTFHIVSRRLSALSVLLRAIVDRQEHVATPLGIAGKAALCAISISFSPAGAASRAYSATLRDYGKEFTDTAPKKTETKKETQPAPANTPTGQAAPPPPPPPPPAKSPQGMNLFRDQHTFAFVDTLENANDTTPDKDTSMLLKSYVDDLKRLLPADTAENTTPADLDSTVHNLITHRGNSVTDSATRKAVDVLLRLTTTDSDLNERTPPEPRTLLRGAVAALTTKSKSISLVRAVWVFGTLKKCPQIAIETGNVIEALFAQASVLQSGPKIFNAAELFMLIPEEKGVMRIMYDLHENLRSVHEIDPALSGVTSETWIVAETKIASFVAGIATLPLKDVSDILDTLRTTWATYAQEETDEKNKALNAYFSTKTKGETDVLKSLTDTRRLFGKCANADNKDDICIKIRQLYAEIDNACRYAQCDAHLLEVAHKLKDLFQAASAGQAASAFGRSSHFV
jgi:hypothetical protein